MKKLLLCITLLFGAICYGQDNSLCKERGHVKGEVIQETLMHCEGYIIDTDTSSVLVFPACNYITYRCLRCGAEIIEQEPERRIILWQGKKEHSLFNVITALYDTVPVKPKMVYDTIFSDYPITRVYLDSLGIIHDFPGYFILDSLIWNDKP